MRQEPLLTEETPVGVGVMTDYERKFYGEGKSINRCVATMVEWTEPEIEDVPSPAE